MPRRHRIADQLLSLPWWANLGIAAVVGVVAMFVVPAVAPATGAWSGFKYQLPKLGWLFSFPFIIAAAASAVRQWLQRQILDRQKDLDSIRALSWQDFEGLVAEAFRRQGYIVTQHGGAGPDGGIDLVLEKSGTKAVVQCKRWRERQVGVSLVRELYGVMTAEAADEAILVTCGEFTPDAWAFARGKAIRLVGGDGLLDMLRLAQVGGPAERSARKQ